MNFRSQTASFAFIYVSFKVFLTLKSASLKISFWCLSHVKNSFIKKGSFWKFSPVLANTILENPFVRHNIKYLGSSQLSFQNLQKHVLLKKAKSIGFNLARADCTVQSPANGICRRGWSCLRHGTQCRHHKGFRHLPVSRHKIKATDIMLHYRNLKGPHTAWDRKVARRYERREFSSERLFLFWRHFNLSLDSSNKS